MRIGLAIGAAALAALGACGPGKQGAGFSHAPSGAALFAQNCTQCHGAKADGNGTMAALIEGGVPDLRGLAARNAGVFPMGYVLEQVGHVSRSKGHGMPMADFGPLLGGAPISIEADGALVETTTPVLAIARYLAGLQGGR
ncbi:MAG: c-type cytochrome [Paracoccaceae bacterium]